MQTVDFFTPIVDDPFDYGRIAALKGKFIFGDIFNGRVFVSDLAAMKKADDGIPQTVAPIEEVQLYIRDASGKRVDVAQVDGRPGADVLHFLKTTLNSSH